MNVSRYIHASDGRVLDDSVPRRLLVITSSKLTLTDEIWTPSASLRLLYVTETLHFTSFNSIFKLVLVFLRMYFLSVVDVIRK